MNSSAQAAPVRCARSKSENLVPTGGRLQSVRHHHLDGLPHRRNYVHHHYSAAVGHSAARAYYHPLLHPMEEAAADKSGSIPSSALTVVDRSSEAARSTDSSATAAARLNIPLGRQPVDILW